MTPTEEQAVAGAARKGSIKGAILIAVLSAILIGASGRPGWIAGYAYILLVAASQVATYKMLMEVSPDLLVERSRLHKSGTERWDQVIAPLVALVLPLATWITAALDARFAWSHVAWPWQAAGIAIVALGIGLMIWAMASNRFFAATARIQTDRGQTVVSRGAYAYVRHPGYVGLIAYILGTPPALGSSYALLPAGLCAAIVVLRTALEDRMLRAGLDGYRGYTLRVRARLLPRVW